MYQMQLSDKKWLIYSIIGDVGIFAYFIGLFIALSFLPEMMADMSFVITMAILILSSITVLIGIVEILIAKYRNKVREMTKSSLFASFGTVTIGTFSTFVFSILALFSNHCPPQMPIDPPIFTMIGGSLLGFVFSYIIFRGFEEKDEI